MTEIDLNTFTLEQSILKLGGTGAIRSVQDDGYAPEKKSHMRPQVSRRVTSVALETVLLLV